MGGKSSGRSVLPLVAALSLLQPVRLQSPAGEQERALGSQSSITSSFQRGQRNK